MISLKFLAIRGIEKYLIKKHIVWLYQTKMGLKNVGASQLLGAREYQPIKMMDLPADDLFLGPDYLTDDNTLLDCSVINSPHLGLMEAIKNNDNIGKTDYIKRVEKGCLDWRRPKPAPQKYDVYYNAFYSSKKKIHQGGFGRVCVYHQNDRYYIFDGKHRAALCAMMGLPVPCKIVSNSIANADLWHYMFSVIEGKCQYSKHEAFHLYYLNNLVNNNEYE